ncbi:hypothetical protein O3G_MSEX013772 [Manduca sexta]|uniref:Uncharacterized protein n=1 Tax=Manduca sexta TaxID=7130 RepID=A0A921ZRZ7_MANSE|nr:hypothetical protein O3G_MSEX013772 [Manduca sexta]
MSQNDIYQNTSKIDEKTVFTGINSLLTNIQHLKQELLKIKLDADLFKKNTFQSVDRKLEDLVNRLDVINNAIMTLETVWLERKKNHEKHVEPNFIGYKNNQFVNGLDVAKAEKNGRDWCHTVRQREIELLMHAGALSSLYSIEELESIVLMFYGRIQELLKATQELRITNNGLGIIGGRLVGNSLKFILASSNALEIDPNESLAQEFRSLDLNHVEIGRAACQVTDVLITLPEATEMLSKYELAGVTVGGSPNQLPRDPSGHGGSSSNGYSEEANSEADNSHGGWSEDSATEDAQGLNTSVDVQHKHAFVNGQQMDIDAQENIFEDSGYDDAYDKVEQFLQDPTMKNFNRLGNNAADEIDAHLQRTCEPSTVARRYACAALCVSSLARHSAAAREAARELLAQLTRYATDMRWPVADALLAGLGLIKSEDNEFKIRWSVEECYSCVAEVLQEPYFPARVRDMLRSFIASKLPTLPLPVRDEIKRYPALYSY